MSAVAILPARPRPAPPEPADAVGAALFQRAQSVATEHVLWAASQGLHPNDVLQAIRAPMHSDDWEVARREVALAWLRLREGERDG